VDGLVAEERAPSLGEAFRFLARLRSFRHIVIAGSLNSFANWALLSWAAAAMMRGHGLSAAEAGSRIAVSVTLFSALGLIAAGLLTDRLGRRDVRWYLWVPAIASFTAFPFLAAFLLLPDPKVAFLVAIPGAFVNSMWVGTFNASIQLLARPRMRATAASLFVLVTSGLIGQGLGPAFVGVLSDRLSSSYGADSLRYALAIAIATSLGAALHSVLAARTLAEDRPSIHPDPETV